MCGSRRRLDPSLRKGRQENVLNGGKGRKEGETDVGRRKENKGVLHTAPFSGRKKEACPLPFAAHACTAGVLLRGGRENSVFSLIAYREKEVATIFL